MGTTKQWIQAFWTDEEGLGTLELLLIVAVLVIVAIAFRKWILNFIKQLFGEANEQMSNTGDEACMANPTTCTQN